MSGTPKGLPVGDGLYSIRKVTLVDICTHAFLTRSEKTSWYEFGIRWVDGEIADDVLALEHDGYAEFEDNLFYEGETYSFQFGEDLLLDVLHGLSAMPEEERAEPTVALRYMIEFDAFMTPGKLRVGGKWIWGGGRGRPSKREPEAFYEHWSKE